MIILPNYFIRIRFTIDFSIVLERISSYNNITITSMFVSHETNY